jgi:hypothetical protein
MKISLKASKIIFTSRKMRKIENYKNPQNILIVV